LDSKMRDRNKIVPRLQLVAWEVTRKCNLRCAHCRASSENTDYEEELSLEECYRLINDISGMGKPILILSGGEPLARDDVFEIGKYGVSKGLRKPAPGSTMRSSRPTARHWTRLRHLTADPAGSAILGMRPVESHEPSFLLSVTQYGTCISRCVTCLAVSLVDPVVMSSPKSMAKRPGRICSGGWV